MESGNDEYGITEFLVFPSTSVPSVIATEETQTLSPTISWTSNQTKVLLDLYQQFRPKVGTMLIRNLKRLWEVLAHELNRILNTNVSANHVENRWRVLERAYRRYKDNQKKTGQAKKYFEYEVEMDNIFRGKKNVDPVCLVSSNDIQEMQENEEESITRPSESSKVELPKQKIVNLKRKRTPVENRNITLAIMRKDRKEYQEERLKLEREKLKLLLRRTEAMEARNLLIKERNEVLKNKKCDKCSQECE